MSVVVWPRTLRSELEDTKQQATRRERQLKAEFTARAATQEEKFAIQRKRMAGASHDLRARIAQLEVRTKTHSLALSRPP